MVPNERDVNQRAKRPPPRRTHFAAPGLLTAAVIAVYPPAPSRLRTVGRTLVALSVLTTASVVATT